MGGNEPQNLHNIFLLLSDQIISLNLFANLTQSGPFIHLVFIVTELLLKNTIEQIKNYRIERNPEQLEMANLILTLSYITRLDLTTRQCFEFSFII